MLSLFIRRFWHYDHSIRPLSSTPDSNIFLAFLALLRFSHSSLTELRSSQVNGASAAPEALNPGVPQGSVLGPILFVLYTHPISEIVSYHSRSHHSFSDDNQLYKSGNITQLPEIIHSTQSCISDVKARMTNNQLQLNSDKTEMVLIATKMVLNSDSVLQSINLEGSDIKFANTVHNLGVCLDPTLPFQQQISSVCRICYLELRRISAIRHYLSEDVTKKNCCVCLDPTLSFQQQISSVVSAILNFIGLVQYATICLKMSPKNCCVRLFFQD